MKAVRCSLLRRRFNTYMRWDLVLHNHLHDVGNAPGRVAHDEHDRDGDGGARDPTLALAQHVLAAPSDVAKRPCSRNFKVKIFKDHIFLLFSANCCRNVGKKEFPSIPQHKVIVDKRPDKKWEILETLS
jgi:hypothetical protein